MTCLRLLLACVLLLPALALAQADYAREKRWADEITPAIVVGDAVQLELKSGRKFLAIYATAPKAAGVILVHGRGAHPDARVVHPLRSQLAEQGYATLSVQMPVLDADAPTERYTPLFPEASERLAAAIAFLRGKGMKKIALVSHSLGSRMANHFLNHAGGAGVEAWVSLGILGEYAQPLTPTIPVLDVYGEHDFPAVLDSSERRAAALTKVRGSGQVQIGGADHFFSGREEELLRQVKRFLDLRLR